MRTSTVIVWIILLPVLAAAVLFGACCILPAVFAPQNPQRQHADQREQQRQPAVEAKLEYLNDIDEIRWWRVEGNDTYIAFDPRPEDMGEIVRAAAAWASAARGGYSRLGVGGLRARVWAIDGSQFPTADSFNPSDQFRYYICAHADEGRVTRTEP